MQTMCELQFKNMRPLTRAGAAVRSQTGWRERSWLDTSAFSLLYTAVGAKRSAGSGLPLFARTLEARYKANPGSKAILSRTGHLGSCSVGPPTNYGMYSDRLTPPGVFRLQH